MARKEKRSLKRQNVRSIEGLTISSNEKEQLLDHIVTIHLFLARNGEAGLELVYACLVKSKRLTGKSRGQYELLKSQGTSSSPVMW